MEKLVKDSEKCLILERKLMDKLLTAEEDDNLELFGEISRGGVVFWGVGGGCDLSDVGGADAAAGHDYDSAGGGANEFCQKRKALQGSGCAAGGEYPGAAGGDDLLEGFEGPAAGVEGLVESDRQRAGGIHDPFGEFEVDASVGE